MSAADWQRIESIYHAVLARPLPERAAFLTDACAGDEAVRREVDSLLAAGAGADSLLKTAGAWPRTTLIGQRLGVYQVMSLLGAGGMGEVYRARDTKLDRDVAIKVLPPAFANDPDRLARFSREAKTLAALNHPNIAQIYGIEGSALVMELVDGQDLSEIIAGLGGPEGPRLRKAADGRSRGPSGPWMSISNTLAIAKQIADALEAAHDLGIIHRDLKPANIKVRADGTVKVLDFGLAKALVPDAAGASADAMNSPTITTPVLSELGIILGTAAYMSPEQAAGKAADKRSDLWSFGVVLFEMLTGRRLFAGETVSHVLAEVLKGEPDWTMLPAETPTAVRRLLRRCLEKDRRRRIADAADVRLELEETDASVDRDSSLVHASSPPASSRGRVGLGIFALTLVCATGVALFLSSRKPLVESSLMRFELSLPEGATNPTVSPDGRQIAYVAASDGNRKIRIRHIDTGAEDVLNETSGAGALFWSPESQAIGFFADGKLKKIDISGQAAQVLVDDHAGGPATWSGTGLILFARNGTIARVSATGGQVTPVTQLDKAHRETSHRRPQFLPDGDHFLYDAVAFASSEQFLYVASLASGTRTLVMTFDKMPRSSEGVETRLPLYVAPGYVLLESGGALVARRFDVGRGVLSGEPVTVAENANALAGSENGVLLYKRVRPDTASTRLLWFDRTGKQTGEAGTPSNYLSLDLSPDDRRVALDRVVAGNRDIWVNEFARSIPTRMTFDPADDIIPVLSPSADRVAFGSGVGEGKQFASRMYQKPVTSTGAAELLFEGDPEEVIFPKQWSPDGRHILFARVSFTNAINSGIWLLPTFGDRKAIPLLPSIYAQPRLSEDGHWLAYATDESGSFQVVVQPFPNPRQEKWQVTAKGGTEPKWRRDGRELFYLDLEGNLMAVTMQGVSGLHMGQPVLLFKTPIAGQRNKTFNKYGVTADGQRFLMIVPFTPLGTGSNPSPVTIMLNWTAALNAPASKRPPR